MKHTRQDLNIMQGWSLEEKIKVSQMKILELVCRTRVTDLEVYHC